MTEVLSLKCRVLIDKSTAAARPPGSGGSDQTPTLVKLRRGVDSTAII